MSLGKTTGDDESADRRAQMARALARGGMEDVHVLGLDTADRALTPKRMEIVHELRDRDVDSVRGLARILERDKGQVSRDLQELAQLGIIHYESEGRSKAPRLSHQHVVVEPIV